MSRIRVVLADDHPPMVAIIRGIVGQEFQVVGTAEEGNQAVDSVLYLNAEVLITDIFMPVANGLQAAERLQMAHCRAKIVFVTVHEDQAFVCGALAARGFRVRPQVPTLARSNSGNPRGAAGKYVCVSTVEKLRPS